LTEIFAATSGAGLYENVPPNPFSANVPLFLNNPFFLRFIAGI
jgi:hypothetical protein